MFLEILNNSKKVENNRFELQYNKLLDIILTLLKYKD